MSTVPKIHLFGFYIPNKRITSAKIQKGTDCGKEKVHVLVFISLIAETDELAKGKYDTPLWPNLHEDSRARKYDSPPFHGLEGRLWRGFLLTRIEGKSE
jgi:hypothetical protein